MEPMTKAEFLLAWTDYMDKGGHSYDPWDKASAWEAYQENPEAFTYILPTKKEY